MRSRTQPRTLLVREVHVEGAEVLLELLRGAYADDRYELGAVPVEEPGDRGLRRRAACLVGDLSNRGDHGGRAFRGTLLGPAQRLDGSPGKHAGAEHAPRGDGEPQLRRHRQHLALGITVGDAVGDLDGDEGRPAAQLGDRIRPRDDPRRRVRDADVEHLAESHLVVERAHELLDRRRRVPHVEPEQVDVVRLQTHRRSARRSGGTPPRRRPNPSRCRTSSCRVRAPRPGAHCGRAGG